MVIAFFLSISLGCSDQSDRPKQVADPQSGASLVSYETNTVYEAARQGDFDTVRSYLDKGFDVNLPDPDRRSLLMLAGFNGHTELCKLLIEKGIKIDARDFNGRTALMFASTGPFADTVRLLLKSGADPNAVDQGEHYTALMHAAAEGHLDVVKVLLENGANKSLKDIDGDTAETFARQNGHIDVADYLKN